MCPEREVQSPSLGPRPLQGKVQRKDLVLFSLPLFLGIVLSSHSRETWVGWGGGGLNGWEECDKDHRWPGCLTRSWGETAWICNSKPGSPEFKFWNEVLGSQTLGGSVCVCVCVYWGRGQEENPKKIAWSLGTPPTFIFQEESGDTGSNAD